MTKSVQDIPKDGDETLADRLRLARDNAGLSRRELADKTGIPPSTLDKYEHGAMDPNTKRLQTLCETLGVSFDWVIYGDAATSPIEKPAENSGAENIAESVAVPALHSMAGNAESVRAMLADLAEMGLHDFVGNQRSAHALAKAVANSMCHMEPDELDALSAEHGIAAERSGFNLSALWELFGEDCAAGEQCCRELGNRIIDKVVFGRDLYDVEWGALSPVAAKIRRQHGIGEEPLFDFSSHKDTLPMVREYLWADAIFGNAPDFRDLEQFPDRA